MKKLFTLFIVACLSVLSANATTYTVTQTTDDGTGTTSGSLSWAINTVANGDIINFNLSSGDVITLSAALPTIDNSLTMEGINIATGNPVTIQVADPGVSAFRVFYISYATAGSSLTLNDLVLRGGDVSGLSVNKGGVICSPSTVAYTFTLNRCVIKEGKAFSGGGATFTCTTGNINMNQCTVSGNTAINGNGGGLYIFGNGIIVNSTIAGNVAFFGGGVYFSGITNKLQLINTTISGNAATAVSGGGGLYVIGNAGYIADMAYLLNCIISNNTPTQYTAGMLGFIYNYFSWIPGITNTAAYAPNVNTAYTPGDLGALADNGGPTQTMALSASAPAYQTGHYAYYNATDGYYFKGTNNLYYKLVSATTSFTPTTANPDDDRITTDQRGATRSDPPSMGAFDGAIATNPMQLVFTTTAAGQEVAIPLKGTVDVVIDWGDGSDNDTITTAQNASHTYATANTNTVSITGTLTGLGTSSLLNEYKNYLTKVLSWGDVGLEDLSYAFNNCGGLSDVPNELPNSVTNLEKTFSGAVNFNDTIGNWNTENVTSTKYMFEAAFVFNHDIGSWDVGNVTNMRGMFSMAKDFNQDIGNWDVSRVKDMYEMFFWAEDFNQDIGDWAVDSVTTLQRMFYKAKSFNQDIGDWNTGSVTNTSMSFAEAYAFDQNIGTWDIGNVTNMSNMFQNDTLSTANYDLLLIGWAAQNVQPGLSFNAGHSQYTCGLAAAARDTLTKPQTSPVPTNRWQITDGGLAAECPMQLEFVTTAANQEIQIPLKGTVNVSIIWGDGSAPQAVSAPGNISHTYTTADTYVVNITGTLTGLGGSAIDQYRNFLKKVYSWGNVGLEDLSRAFDNCDSLTYVPNELPATVTNLSAAFTRADNFNADISNWNTANVTNMSNMFNGAAKFNQNIGNWNTGKVTDMQSMFYKARQFNQDLNQWDVQHVKNMKGMFLSAFNFNGLIGSWQVDSVTDMSNMFNEASVFNQDISNWNVSRVTKMTGMFSYASKFNQNIGAWDVDSVSDMSHMFRNALEFNSNISSWDVGNVSNMLNMFAYAYVFNQDISGWDVGNVTDMSNMFSEAHVFNQDISGWDVSRVKKMEKMFYYAIVFDQNIGSWAVDSVTSMSSMFYNANVFNQDLSAWDVSAVTSMAGMFGLCDAYNHSLGDWNLNSAVVLTDMLNNCGMDCESYSSTLKGWAENPNLPIGRTLGADGLTYGTDAAAYRDTLTINRGWTINGDNLGTSECLCSNPDDGGSIASSHGICPGATPDSLTSAALPSGYSGTPEYKWQSSTTSDSTGFADIANTNSAGYQPVTISDTTWYRRLARVDCMPDWTDAAASNVVKIYQYETFSPGSIETAGDSICPGGDPDEIGSLSDASGGNEIYTYAWYSSTNSFADSSLIAGATDASYDPPSGLAETTSYRRQAHDGSCNTTFENATGTWTIIVGDTIAPELSVKNFTVYLDNSGAASITAASLVTSASDNCSIADTTLTKITSEKSALIRGGALPPVASLNFSCSDAGDNSVEVKLTDGSANIALDTVTVTVADTISPVAHCKNIIVYLEGNGQINLDSLAIDDGSSDNCSIASFGLDVSSFGCADLGGNTVTLTATDGSGNTATCLSTVTVKDTLNPELTGKDITVYLDNTGSATVKAQDVVALAGDNCSIADTTLTKVTNLKSAMYVNPAGPVTSLDYNCSGTGANSVEIQLRDESGNIALDTVTVTVLDTISPVAVCKDTTVYLDAAGQGSLDSLALNNNSSDNCSLASLVLDVSSFDCADLGDNTITMTVTDISNNTATCQSTVTVADTISPVAHCKNIIVYLEGNGQINLDSLAIDDGSSDNCSIASFGLDVSSFGCADLGGNTVTLTATDGSGNTATCLSTVTVKDTLNPELTGKDITVYLDNTGSATVKAQDVVALAGDNCSIADTTLTKVTNLKSAMYVNPAGPVTSLDYNCSGTGANSVEIQLRDESGNIALDTVTVTVLDTISPVAVCKDTTVYLDAAGQGSLDSLALNNNSSDNCSLASLVLDVSSFDCADLGDNTITMTVTDISNNTATCQSTVTVTDTISPVAACKNITVYLDENGTVSLDSLAINDGSSDNCSIASFALDVNSFDCDDLDGGNTVTLTVTDAGANTATCLSTVTVKDTLNPELTGKDITVYLDNTGSATVKALDVVALAGDNCSVADTTLTKVTNLKSAMYVNPAGPVTSLDYNCSGTGANSVEIQLRDESGNIALDTVTVTVLDTISPVAVCKDTTVYLDAAGQGSLDSLALNNNSSDNCSLASLVLDVSSFDCADLGDNTITMTVTDISNNTATCQSTVTVTDTISPVAACKNITVYLDENGTVSLDSLAINDGSSDNCSIASFALDVNSFDCDDLDGGNTVTLTVTDDSGNTATCQSTVTVKDTIAPKAVCKDLNIILDAGGKASVLPDEIGGSSTDACGIDKLQLTKTQFTCDDLGVNTVTLTATDVNGNQSFCTAKITVTDNSTPKFETVDDVELELEQGICESKIDYPEIVVTDNCNITLELTNGLGKEGLFPIGTTTETWKATDLAGNTSELSFHVTIETTNALPTLDVIADVSANEDDNAVWVNLTGIGYGNDCIAQNVTVSAVSNDTVLVDSVAVEYTNGDSTATLELLLARDMSDTAEITVTVEDSEGGVATETFVLTVQPVNDPPFLVSPVADQTVHASYVLKVPFSSIPGEMFDDRDDYVLVVTAAQEGTDSLPGWAIMVGDTLVCEPTIADTGCVSIVVFAFDAAGAFATDTFSVCVEGYPVSIGDLGAGKFEVNMYPNPSNGKVNLHFNTGVYDFELSVMDVTGKTVLRKSYTASEHITFDMSGKVAGMYFVQMDIAGTRLIKKLIIN